jgi:HlyD family secretion protein
MNMDKKIKKKKWTAKRLSRYAVLLLIVLIAFIVLMIGNAGTSLNVNIGNIMIASVKKGLFEEYIPITGNVLPQNTVNLDAVEGGRVERVFVESGTVVKKGDKLLKLSNPDLQLTLLNNEVQIYRARNELRLAQMELDKNRLTLEEKQMDAELNITTLRKKLERFDVLFKDEIIAKEEYEKVKDEYDYWVKKQEHSKVSGQKDLEFREEQIKHQETSFMQMKKHIRLIREQNRQLTVTAPISGKLTSLKAEKGESIPRGKRLGQIDPMTGYKVEADINEHYLQQISTGLIGKCRLAGHTVFLEISKIYPEVKEGKFKIALQFKGEAPGNIKRGQTLHIRLRLGGSSTAILLPRGGFFQESGGRYVFVLDQEGKKAYRRPIRLGKQNPEVFEVLEGLKPGERVIISSYELYKKMEKLTLN